MARCWPVAVAAVVIAVVGAGAVAALSFDPASQRDRIVQAVRRATGRELTLAGPIRVHWGLTPVLEAEDVSFANMPGGSRPQMVAVARVEARVDLLPLLSRRMELASVTLVRPDILLETDANGRGNWVFDRPAAVQGPVSTSSPGPRLATQLDSLRVESGRVTWHDGVTGQVHVVELPSASFDLGGGPAHLLAQAEVLGTDVRLDATGGTWAQLTGAVPGPWPLKLHAAAGDATVAVNGEADPAAHRVTGRVEASVPDLAQFGALVERPGLPPLKDVHVAATLPPTGGLPQDISLQVGASDLGSVLAGTTLGRLSLTWPAGQPARVEAEGAVYGGPWHLAAGGVPAGQGVALRALTVSSPLLDAMGDLAIRIAPRPSLVGTLVLSRVDADAIRGALRSARAAQPTPVPAAPAQAAPAQGAVSGPPATAASEMVIPDTPLPWGVLRQADAALDLRANVIRWGGVDYRNASGRVSLQDGVGQLDNIVVTTPAGRVSFSASFDARAPAPPVNLNLQAGGISLDALLQAAGLPGGSDGTAELDVMLQATGVSPHALAASLTGHAGVALVDGEIANAALAASVGSVVKQASAGLDPAGRSHIRCLAVRADATGGVVNVSALKLDTSRLELTGGGTVNLADETLALHLHPLLRLGAAGVSAPLLVDGTLRHPLVALDPAAGSGRTSVVIGGLAGPADSCAPELTAARDGRPGPLPAEVAASNKLPKPSDILRSFIR